MANERCCHVEAWQPMDHDEPMHFTQCEKVATRIHDGKYYCKEHAPEGARTTFIGAHQEYVDVMRTVSVDAAASDPTNPPHYNRHKHEPWDVIDDWRLTYRLGCVLKYISRHQHKGKPLQDLKKARAYLDAEISRMEGQDG